MRPVRRGAEPDGMATYEEMRPALLTRLGRYCSYCEYPVKHVAHAEHILPKDRYRAHRNRWDNLLVACTYCNGHKGDERPTPATVDAHLWPERDNTARAFTYENVHPRTQHLGEPAQSMAARLYGLVRLSPTDDERAKERASVFVIAKWFFAELQTVATPDLWRLAIVKYALASGFFSVWMEIFATDPETRGALIAAFPGTATDCFDAATAPVPRPGARL